MLIQQYLGTPSEAELDQRGHLIVLLPKGAPQELWDELPYGALLSQRFQLLDHAAGMLVTDLPNPAATRVVLGTVADGISPFALLSLARKLAAAGGANPREIGILIASLPTPLAARAAEAQVAALLAAAHAMPSFKSTPAKPCELATVHLYGLAEKLDLTRTQAEAEGNNLARYLTALPANQLTPRQYRESVTALAKQHRWKMRFLDTGALQKQHAGAFLAVAQGSPEADAGMVHLRYTPSKKFGSKPGLGLVGKGICFDTGGTNLKSARHMHGMHQDMAGSAVALGVLLALTRLQVNFPVDCWLALAQNHIGPNAYKQNDVVTASNGTTIEVIHTDAEGRMVLADTLVLASRDKPMLLLDFATLTGSCVAALGTSYSGALSNRDDMVAQVIAAGQASGERVWPFPMDEDFDELLESDIADIKQCTLDSEADHILAARFLQRFVPDEVPWLHLDLAAAEHKGGLAHIPTAVTGFGVRFTLELLHRQGLLPSDPAHS